MSLFRKKKWDIERSEQNKGLIRQLFSQAMPDGDTWKIVYGYGLNIKTSDYIIARKTTYTYTSLIIGYRESDMSIALLQTTPELEGCSEAETGERKSDVQLLIERIQKIQSELPALDNDISEEEAAFTEAAEEQLAQTQAQRRFFYLRR